jgi:predicted permease
LVFLNAVSGVFTIFLLIGTGVFLSYKKWFDERSKILVSKLVTNLALPAYMISNLLTTYTKEKLASMASGLVIPFVTIILGTGIGYLLIPVLKIKKGRRGIFATMFGFCNTIFVGLPVNLALFGDKSIPYVLIYYIANTTLFWTFGSYFISKDGGNKGKLISMDSFKRIMSPPLLGFLGAIVLILLGITLPNSIMDFCKYVGGLTTPLSMLFIGIVIQSVDYRILKIDRGMLAILFGRFIFSPGMVLLMSLWHPMPTLMRNVFIIQAAMPAMTNTAIVAQMYDADYEYAAVVTTLTTIVSLIAIPIYMVMIS